ncbi:MAG: 3-isopropylmalate dehydratase small subunit [Acidobacteria bacterium]|nr:3-isopropylmalate dehydratase small subunit [Acidobacteriota bacterium]
MKFKGQIHKYGDNINTDVIIPARYCSTIDERELARHCLEDLDEEFIKKVKYGDILVGGNNFGCGSSREVAPIAIKASGISCIISKFFARIFYRNSINIGLPIIECFEFVEEVSLGETVEISLDEGTIYNVSLDKVYHFKNAGETFQDIMKSGGLINYIKAKKMITSSGDNINSHREES